MVENNYGPRGISPALKVKVALLCLTVCDPHGQSMEFSRPKYCSGYFPFPSPGDLPKPQEWKQDLPHCRQILYQLSHKGSPSLALCIWGCVCVWELLSCVWLFVTPWSIQSTEFIRPEYWSGYFSSPGDLSNPGIEPRSSTSQVDCLPAEPQGLMETSWWERLTEGETGSCSDGRGHVQ